MAQSFSLSTATAVFACPACNETINTSMQQCAFCATPIDAAAAQSAADAMSRISRACSDGSYLKIMAGMLIPFFFLQFLVFASLIGAAGIWFLKFAIPFMTIRWWIRYGSIITNDPDYARARLGAFWVSVVAILCLGLLVSNVVSYVW
jgi:hypothetical protein